PKFAKFGRSVCYPIAELEAFVAKSLRTSTSDRGAQAVPFNPRIRPVGATWHRALGQVGGLPVPSCDVPRRAPTRRRHSISMKGGRTRISLLDQDLIDFLRRRAR